MSIGQDDVVARRTHALSHVGPHASLHVGPHASSDVGPHASSHDGPRASSDVGLKRWVVALLGPKRSAR